MSSTWNCTNIVVSMKIKYKFIALKKVNFYILLIKHHLSMHYELLIFSYCLGDLINEEEIYNPFLHLLKFIMTVAPDISKHLLESNNKTHLRHCDHVMKEGGRRKGKEREERDTERKDMKDDLLYEFRHLSIFNSQLLVGRDSNSLVRG